MSKYTLSADDFTSALQNLLPTGLVWLRDRSSIQSQTVAGLAAIYATQSARALDLLTDAFPSTTDELLTEWEDTLGLPDSCVTGTQTLAQRQKAVVARFANSGGQSADYYIGYASNLGYDITIQNYAPFRCGESHAGDPIGLQEWFFTWAVETPENTISYFVAGDSTAGEALATWENSALECELDSIKPAHTYLNFIYT